MKNGFDKICFNDSIYSGIVESEQETIVEISIVTFELLDPKKLNSNQVWVYLSFFSLFFIIIFTAHSRNLFNARQL